MGRLGCISVNMSHSDASVRSSPSEPCADMLCFCSAFKETKPKPHLRTVHLYRTFPVGFGGTGATADESTSVRRRFGAGLAGLLSLELLSSSLLSGSAFGLAPLAEVEGWLISLACMSAICFSSCFSISFFICARISCSICSGFA